MCRMMGVVSRGPVYYDLFEEFADLATQACVPSGHRTDAGATTAARFNGVRRLPPMCLTWQSPFGVLPLGRRSRSSRKWGLVGPTACRLFAPPYKGGSAVSTTKSVCSVREAPLIGSKPHQPKVAIRPWPRQPRDQWNR